MYPLQVNNTDAEGRLTLADALVYACNQGVEKVLSKCHISTLFARLFAGFFLLFLVIVDTGINL